MTLIRPTARVSQVKLGLVALLALSYSCWGQQYQWIWEPIGANGDVRALAVFDDGSGPAVYAAGYFSTIGGMNALCLAKYDGKTWESVGGGVDNFVLALTIHDDGSGEALHVGGRIKKAGGVSVSHVAKWDGQSWSPVGDGIKDAEDTVLALASRPGPHGATLYAGGYFRYAGGALVQYIAELQDGHWTSMNGGLFGGTYALASFDPGSGASMYIGGDFTKAGGKAIAGVAGWNGVQWSDPGADFSAPAIVRTILPRDDPDGSALYVAGSMKRSNNLTINGICRWNGEAWSALGDGVGSNGAVLALASLSTNSGELLIAGGGFTQAGSLPANNIAAWDGQSWSPIGEGVGDNYVWSLASADFGDGPILFVGGWFEEAGGLYSPNLAMVRCVPICIADCDASGAIDLADFACFQSSFAAGDLKADCDGNATLDLFDFLCFLNAFNAGCP